MDSEACVDLCKESEEKQDESIGTIEVNNDVPPKAKVVEATDCLVPITPDSGRENGDFQSPLTLTVVRKQLKLACIDSERNASGSVDNNNCSPRTPKDGVFDPFAHGPDYMARAPYSNKCLDESRIGVARQLNFHVVQQQNPFHDAESLSDNDMFESVYENILQVIVSNQSEEGVSVLMSNVECDSVDCKTPPSPPHFTGIADTCPGAPRKPACKPRNIQPGLCKKLEF
ncbi:uncharacterized protein LOC133311460 [Gastrolobium bilobum]|uniref:uncharacterized protein LOC133311460 n=1 Tax=Gastrolobium bilobum TaxID=150636 RepID=UPI002AB2AF35|nr:uncharacterized protein LOC133311460 [Gastrolobium bilobum]